MAQFAGREVHRRRAGAFAEADDRHLQQPAADVAGEIRVRFHAVEEHDAVGRERFDGAPHRLAVGRHADLFHLERSLDRRAHGFLGEIVARENYPLALGRGAAVAAHRGKNKRLRPRRAQQRQHLRDDRFEIRDAATANPDGDPRTGSKLRAKFGKLRRERRPQIERRCAREILPDADEAWKRVHAASDRLLDIAKKVEPLIFANGRGPGRDDVCVPRLIGEARHPAVRLVDFISAD